MKYYYERPEHWLGLSHEVYNCNHPLYDRGSLFVDDDRTKGLIIVQQRFNSKGKISWWGPIDPWIADDLVFSDAWSEWFDDHAEPKDEQGLYPTYSVRKAMWAMRLKPLKREIFEQLLEGDFRHD